MSGAEIAFTIGSALTAAVLAIAGYFIDKWIKSVDQKLQRNSGKINDLKYEIRDAKIHLDYEHIADEVSKKIREKGLLGLHDIGSIKRDVNTIKDTLQIKVLPQIEKSKEYFGKIIIVEEHMEAQEKKLRTLYDAVLKVVGPK